MSEQHDSTVPPAQAGVDSSPDLDVLRRQLQTIAENATLALFIMDES